MREAFLDAGYLIALEFRRDQNHAAALAHWRENVRTRQIPQPQLVTTSYVFDEVVTYLNARGRHERAVEVGERLLHSPSVDLIHVDEDLFHKGFDYFKAHHDKRYSLTDCISFVIMTERGLATAFAFDHHFTQAGFAKEP
ncbi:MAG: PIN domain-containing protein [Actinomycetota bacterium]|jgi:predicted nucleic acid-binding protein|nr:PIN domain-containing protein [Actinomycetota bacterium]